MDRQDPGRPRCVSLMMPRSRSPSTDKGSHAMITIDYHPLVEAVVDAWRSRLPRAVSPLPVSEGDLRDLVARLSRAIEILSRSRSVEELEREIRGDVKAGGEPAGQ